MKKTFLILSVFIPLVGCASPIDWLVPAPKQEQAEKFLGEDTPNGSFMPYNTLADSKAQKAAIDAKLQVLKAQGELAKVELAFVEKTYDPVANGLWSLLLMAAAALGWVIPAPTEKAKVIKAQYEDPPNKNVTR